ncbi:MAG: alpha-galactosidase, partial [Firmicutes bacterium]|nr:alpha-galactosidase [Bacillota bacterium]
MIQNIGNIAFILSTPKTAYAFALLPTGQLEHLYYGAPLQLGGPSGFIDEASAEGSRLLAALEPLREKHAFGPGTSVIYDRDHPQYSLDDMRLEYSAPGKGDLRDPALELTNADGSLSSDFRFESAEIIDEKLPFKTLPGSYFEEGNAQQLCISLLDKENKLKLELCYYVFEDCDVISRSARLVNLGDEPVSIRRFMSLQLDLDRPGYVFSGFTGAWAREMQRTDTLLNAGRYSLGSRSGASSHRANPFVMLHPSDTTEDHGEVYGFNLIYSGNHLESAEVSPFGKTRFMTGINPEGFGWTLQPGED